MNQNDERIKQILNEVYDILKERNYNPIDQLTGYIASGDPTYICSYKDARNKIKDLFGDEIVEVLLKEFFSNK